MIYGGDTSYSIWSAINEQLLPNTEDSEAQLKNSLYGYQKGPYPWMNTSQNSEEACQIPILTGKNHQGNKTRKLVKFVVEQTTLPLSDITGMNTVMQIKTTPKKH